jgi:hypothetical protein
MIIIVIIEYIIDRIKIFLKVLKLKKTGVLNKNPLSEIMLQFLEIDGTSSYQLEIFGELNEKKSRNLIIKYSLMKFIYKFEFRFIPEKRDLYFLVQTISNPNKIINLMRYEYDNFISLEDINHIINLVDSDLNKLDIFKITIITRTHDGSHIIF